MRLEWKSSTSNTNSRSSSWDQIVAGDLLSSVENRWNPMCKLENLDNFPLWYKLIPSRLNDTGISQYLARHHISHISFPPSSRQTQFNSYPTPYSNINRLSFKIPSNNSYDSLIAKILDHGSSLSPGAKLTPHQFLGRTPSTTRIHRAEIVSKVSYRGIIAGSERARITITVDVANFKAECGGISARVAFIYAVAAAGAA